MSPAAVGRRWRHGVVRRLPVALMEYPFECFMALIGALMGTALVVGATRPGSLFAVLPTVAVVAYSVAAIAGAVTVTIGLVPRRKNPIPMAIGLRLIAVLLGVYGVAVVGYSGFEAAGFAGIFFVGISALAGFRSMWLRAQAEASLATVRREE